MARCPTCNSARIVVVLSATSRAFCAACGSRWVQEGAVQRQVERGLTVAAVTAFDPVAPAEHDESEA